MDATDGAYYQRVTTASVGAEANIRAVIQIDLLIFFPRQHPAMAVSPSRLDASNGANWPHLCMKCVAGLV